MFDVGFFEVSLIAIVALVVVGPERLPRLARTVGLYVGKARRVLRDVRSEIDREISRAELGEIKDIKDTVTEAKSQIDRAAADVSKTLSENVMATADGNDKKGTNDSGTANQIDMSPQEDQPSAPVTENTIHQASTSSDNTDGGVSDASQSGRSEETGTTPSNPVAATASMAAAAAGAANALGDPVRIDENESFDDTDQTGSLPIPPDDDPDDK